MLFGLSSVGAIVTAAALAMMVAGAAEFDELKYPDWSGQWQRPRGPHFQRPSRRALGVIGTQNYFISGDGYVMPARKAQPPADRRYFKPTGR